MRPLRVGYRLDIHVSLFSPRTLVHDTEHTLDTLKNNVMDFITILVCSMNVGHGIRATGYSMFITE